MMMRQFIHVENEGLIALDTRAGGVWLQGLSFIVMSEQKYASYISHLEF